MANNFTITISAVDKATSVARKVNKSLERITDPINRLGKETKALSEHFSVIGKMTGITQIGKGFKKLGGSAISAARSVASIVTPVAALTAAGVVAGVVALADGFGRTATSVRNAAAALGMPAQRLQAYQGAARLVGLASEDMTGGLKALGGTLEDSVTGRNLEAASAMNQFGISVHRLKNGSIDTTRALHDIADVIRRMPNAQAQQKFASIFGIEQLLPMLQRGGDGIDKLVNKAKSLGAVMTPEQIAAGERYNEQMVALDLQVERLKITFGNALAPAVERVVGVVGRLVDKYGAVVGSRIAEYAQKLADWVNRTDWGGIASQISGFVGAIGGIKTIALGLAAITFGGAIKGIYDLTKGVKDLVQAVRGRSRDAAIVDGVAGGGAGKGLVPRILPWIARLGIPLWLATHSESLNTGEDEYLEKRRAKPAQAWGGDIVAERRQEASSAGPKDRREVRSVGAPVANASGAVSGGSIFSGDGDAAYGSLAALGALRLSDGDAYGNYPASDAPRSSFADRFAIDLRGMVIGRSTWFAGESVLAGLSAATLASGIGSLPSADRDRADANDAAQPVQADSASRLGASSTSLKSIYASRPVEGSDASPTAIQSIYAPRPAAASVPSSGIARAAPIAASRPRIVVDVALKNAPQGTTARVMPTEGVSATVRIDEARRNQPV